MGSVNRHKTVALLNRINHVKNVLMVNFTIQHSSFAFRAVVSLDSFSMVNAFTVLNIKQIKETTNVQIDATANNFGTDKNAKKRPIS